MCPPMSTPTSDADRAMAEVGELLARLGVDQTSNAVGNTLIRAQPAPPPGPALPTIVVTSDGSTDLVARGELGRGGMGIVQLAEQRSLLRDVAVKSGLGGKS